MRKRPAASQLRRARVRHAFSEPRLVTRERTRLLGSAERELRGQIIERFLRLHLAGLRGPVLEVGPGPGRFTPVLLENHRKVLLLDLSRPMLRAARRSLQRRPWGYLEGMAEGRLPFRDGSLAAVVLVGLFGFFGDDGELVLREARRVVKPGGRVIVETTNLVQATASLAPEIPEGFRKIFREPSKYYLKAILETGLQPYDPARMARWEYRFWRGHELEAAMTRSGLTVRDRLAVAPMLGSHAKVLRVFRRDPRAWANLVRYEEAVGRWEDCRGAGVVTLAVGERPKGRGRT